MAKKDDVILIIAKSFSRQNLTENEIEICKNLSVTELISEYGLNEVQSAEVVKWCAISCAAMPINHEILEEGLFSGFLDRFRRNKPEQKSQQSMSTLVANNIKNFIDDNELSEFLFTAKEIIDDIKSKGLYREINPPKKLAGEPRGPEGNKDLYGDFIDIAQGDKDFSYTADLSKKHLLNLSILKDQIELIYNTIQVYQLPKTSAKIDENAPVTRTQLYKSLTRENPRKMQFYKLNALITNPVYRQALGNQVRRQLQIKELVSLLFKNARITNRKEKLQLISALETYVGEIFNNVQNIIAVETQSSNLSHSNYSKTQNDKGNFMYNTYSD